MDRRREFRRARRVPVRFRVPGEEKVRSGFTTDISRTGMFIGTNHVLGSGTRVRVEVVDAEAGFMVEGVVARSLRPTPLMRQIQPSGMGIRFLQVDELIGGLFPQAAPVEPTTSSGFSTKSPVGSAPPPQGPSQPSPQQSSPPRSSPPPRRGFVVRFRTAADLDRTWRRDVAQGGLFVSAREPAEVGSVILLEIRPPEDAPMGTKVRLDAKVVHRFEPGSGDETNLLSGMGVEFVDPDAARASLGTLLGRR